MKKFITLLYKLLPFEIKKHIIFLNKNLSVRKWYNSKYTDAIILSFPKCGRTWLRIMIGRALQKYYNIQLNHDQNLIQIDTLAKYNSKVPIIHTTHDDLPYLKKPKELISDKKKFRNIKVILLVRDPRDVIVSLYYERKYRTKDINRHNYDGSLNEFIKEERGSFNSLLKYYQIWANNQNIPRDFIIIRYEDLHNRPEIELKKIFSLLGIKDISNSILEEAVEYASFKNMRKLESNDAINNTSLQAAQKSNYNTYKTRKGKIHGYKDELDKETIKYLDKKIIIQMPKIYGYS